MPVLQANILVDFPELKLVFLVLEGWIDWLEFLLPLANTQLAIELLLYPRTYQIVVQLPLDNHRTGIHTLLVCQLAEGLLMRRRVAMGSRLLGSELVGLQIVQVVEL